MSALAKTQTEHTNELSTDLSVITAEINAYKRVAGEAIFEIGRRLKHVKENDLAHGEYGKFLESIDMDRSQAAKFVKVYEEVGEGNVGTYTHLGLRALYEIATLPPEERDRPQEVPSTGEVKKPEDMTVRELREVKKALKEREAALEAAEKAKQAAESESQTLRKQLESVESRPEPEVKTVENPVTAAKLKRYESMYGDIDGGDGIYRIDNATEVNGAALDFSTDVRDLLQKYAHLSMYSAEFSAMNKASAREYQSAIDSLKEFINAIERNMPHKSDEPVIIDVH